MALLVVPIVMERRRDAYRSEVEEVVAPARELVDELELTFARQAATVRVYAIEGSPRSAALYRSLSVQESRLLLALSRLVRRIDDPRVHATLDTLERRVVRFHARHEQLLAGRLTAAEYERRTPPGEPEYERLLRAAEAVDDELGRVDDALQEAIDRSERLELLLTIGLALLALLSALAVIRIQRRQRALARALARTARQETALRRELERVLESRARLVRGFSHDLKNPLAAADGYLELLELGIRGELAPEQREGVARSRRSIHSAMKLIQDLVDLAQAEAGQLRLRLTPVDLRQVVRDVVEEYRARADMARLTLTLDIDESLPMALCDRARCVQILGNLLSNAVKYTPEGGRVTVRARRCVAPDRICIDVADTGPGVPEDKREAIFREYTRLAPERARGVGLGLAISRSLARLMGGDVTVESEPGRGATFTLALPAAGRRAAREAA